MPKAFHFAKWWEGEGGCFVWRRFVSASVLFLCVCLLLFDLFFVCFDVVLFEFVCVFSFAFMSSLCLPHFR